MDPKQDLNLDKFAGGGDEEYRRVQEQRDKRRQKKRRQKLILLGAFVLAGVLLVVVLVMLFRAVIRSGESAGTSSGAAVSGSDVSAVSEIPLPPAWTAPADPTAWNLVYVSPQHPLDTAFQFTPGNVPTQVGGVWDSFTVDERIVEDVKALITACNADGTNSLRIVSGYRGQTRQNEIHTALVEQFMAQGHTNEEAVALANRTEPGYGYSEHQTGLAMAFTTNVLGGSGTGSMGFAETPEYAWLLENAKNYGFILRYPQGQESVTGMDFQPYLFRYVGVEAATVISEYGITLDEYLSFGAATAAPSEAEPVDDPRKRPGDKPEIIKQPVASG